MFLGAFFILTSINILNQYFSRFTEVKFEIPHILFVSDIIGFLYGPIIYLYARLLIYKDFNVRQYFHFLPALVFTVFFVIYEFIINAPFKFFDYINTPLHKMVLLLIVISNVIYFLLFIQISARHRFNTSRKGIWVISWLSVFYIFFALKMLTGLTFFIYQAFLEPMENQEASESLRGLTEYVFILFNAVIIVVTGYWSVKNPFEVYNLSDKQIKEIDSRTESLVSENGELTIKKQKQESGFKIPVAEARERIAILDELIKEGRHLDPDLNEREMAKDMDVPLHYLSNLLNEHVNESFTEFINRHRIEEAKLKLADRSTDNLTIFAIALDCGYNSESTFYTNFKKYTGTTPNLYKRRFSAS